MSAVDRSKLAKLTDFDAAWVTSWSSVVSGAVKKEDGGNLIWSGVPESKQSYDPVLIVRDFSQQTALSVHYISSKNVKTEWDNTTNYTIS